MSDSPPIPSKQSAHVAPTHVAPKVQQSDAAKNAKQSAPEVIIKQVSPTQVSVRSSNQGQSVTLDSTDIKGQIDSNQRYNVTITSRSVLSSASNANVRADVTLSAAASVSASTSTAPQPTATSDSTASSPATKANAASNSTPPPASTSAQPQHATKDSAYKAANTAKTSEQLTKAITALQSQSPTVQNASLNSSQSVAEPRIAGGSNALTSNSNTSSTLQYQINKEQVNKNQLTSTPVLEFTKAQPLNTNIGELNRTISSQQLERLLRLPPSQFQAARIPPSLLTTQAQVVSQSGQTLTLNFNVLKNQQNLSLAVSPSTPSTIKNQDTVNVQLKPVGSHWQVLLSNKDTGTQSIASKAANEHIAPVLKQLLVNGASSSSVPLSQRAPTQTALTSPALSINIDSKVLSKSLSQALKTAPIPDGAPRLDTTTRAPNIASSQRHSPQKTPSNTGLLEAIQNIPPTKISIAINKDGSANIQNMDALSTSSPPVQLKVTQQNISNVLALIKTLNITVDPQTLKALASMSDAANNALAKENSGSNHLIDSPTPKDFVAKNSVSAVASVRQGISKIINALGGERAPEVKSASAMLGKGITPEVSTKALGPNPSANQNAKVEPTVAQAESVKTPTLDKLERRETVNIAAPEMTAKVKAQAIEVLHTLLRVVQARAEQPSESLNRLASALNDTQFIEEPAVKNIKEQVLEQIKQNIPQGKEQDAGQIRQLLTNQALSLSATQIISPVAGQGMLSGLVTLIQISLASRFARNQPQQGEKVSQGLNALFSSDPISSAGKTQSSAPVSPKGLSEFAQLEQKHQILREISRFFAGHQSSKISNAEQLLQGQDSFYYTLPSAFGNKLQDIELLVKRENDTSKDQQNEGAANSRIWHLTMKLSAGDLGELLTKAKLRQGTLELDFYTSNEQTKHQVMNYLPLFNKRLTALGIEVTKSQCQLGKIPDTLRQRPYQLLQTQV